MREFFIHLAFSNGTSDSSEFDDPRILFFMKEFLLSKFQEFFKGAFFESFMILPFQERSLYVTVFQESNFGILFFRVERKIVKELLTNEKFLWKKSVHEN